MVDVVGPKWGPPETHFPGQLLWKCQLPGHTGQPRFVVRADADATTGCCMGNCGLVSADEFVRLTEST